MLPPRTKTSIRSVSLLLCAITACLVAWLFGDFVYFALAPIFPSLLLRLLVTGIVLYFVINPIVDFVRDTWFS